MKQKAWEQYLNRFVKKSLKVKFTIRLKSFKRVY